MLRTCQHCATIFHINPAALRRPGRGQFCSLACKGAARRMEREERPCLHCGTVFLETVQRIHDGRGKYCSKHCLRAAQKLKIDVLCLVCLQPFPSGQWARSHGQAQYCSKACYDKAYNQRHAEKIAHKRRTSYFANHADNLAKKAAYRAAHPEQFKAWRKAHREQQIARSEQYNATHRTQILIARKVHYKKHPDIYATQRRRRRAQRNNAAINDFTHAQWLMLQAAFDHRCAYCQTRAKGHLT